MFTVLCKMARLISVFRNRYGQSCPKTININKRCNHYLLYFLHCVLFYFEQVSVVGKPKINQILVMATHSDLNWWLPILLFLKVLALSNYMYLLQSTVLQVDYGLLCVCLFQTGPVMVCTYSSYQYETLPPCGHCQG